MAFISVADFGKFTGIVTEKTDMVELCLGSATEIVESYLGYGLALAKYATTRNGNGTHELQLKARPIKTLLRVTIGGAIIPAGNFETSNEFLVYKNGIFPAGNRNIQAVYWAGFTPPGDVDIGDGDGILDGGNAGTEVAAVDLDGGGATLGKSDAALPVVIKNTILRIAALLHTESQNNIGVTSKSFADSGSRTFVSFTNFKKYLSPISGHKLIRI